MRTSRPVLGIVLAALPVIAGLLAYASSRRAPALPETPETEMPSDAGRLMPPSDPGLSLYTNAAHQFYLRHPSEIEPIEDRGEMSRLGYIPVCDPGHAIACFPYGKEKYARTNFESAAFSVRLRDDLKNEKDCLAPGNGETQTGFVAVGEEQGKSFSFGDAATSHRLDGMSERFFRDGECIELTRAVGTTVFEVYEPGSIREFTAADRADVDAVLERIRQSFRFQEDLELI